MSIPQTQAAAQLQTDFLSASDAARLVMRTGITQVLRLMSEAIEADFMRWQDFDKSARTAAHSASGVIELMPVADAQDYAFKYVNGHPHNPQLGLPTVMAFGALADVATGMPRFVSELTLTTALRTAATSAMAAKHLARKDSRSMALIGNGSQSEFQALAFVGLLGVRELRLFDIEKNASSKLLRNIEFHLHEYGAQVRICGSVEEAVHGADIVTTVTADKTYATILTPEMIEPGMHINAVGGDCPGKTELHADILKRSSIFVEYTPQTRIEGEIQQLDADHPVTEVWQVLTGEAEGRRDAREITLFDSVGFAIEDFSALRYVHDRVRKGAPHVLLDMLADPDDPRDLFGMLERAK